MLSLKKNATSSNKPDDMAAANAAIKHNLVLAYHIIAHLGLDDHTYTHLSSRSAEEDAFFIYPFGLRFEEVTTDNLMKVKFDGSVVEGQEHQYNKTGYMIHGATYQARPDINHIFHTHTPHTAAVSAMKNGLLPISQWALHFYNRVAYHGYNSLALDHDHGNDMVHDLGDKYVMLMCNHGALMCGRTIQEAMFYTYHLEQACKTQCIALAANQELIMPSAAVCEQSVKDLLTFEQDLGQRDWQAWIRLIERKQF